MALPFIVLGAGGHSRVVVDLLRVTGARILGLVDADVSLRGTTRFGLPILGGDEVLTKHGPEAAQLAMGIASVKTTTVRAMLYRKHTGSGFKFGTLVHPTATIASDAQIGEGVQVMAGAIVQSGARLGNNVLINTGAIVEHDTVVGDHAHLAPGTLVAGGANIGMGAHVGLGSICIQNIRIEENATVGAGAVVVANVPAGVTVVGVPAKVTNHG